MLHFPRFPDVLRTWLRRWLGLDHVPEPLGDSRARLERRVDELEQHVDWLHGSLRKLRGRVTGGLRSADPDGGDGGPVNDAPPVTSGNPRAIELLKKRGRL